MSVPMGSVQARVITAVLSNFKPGEKFTEDDLRYMMGEFGHPSSVNKVLHGWHRRELRLKATRKLIRGHYLCTDGNNTARKWWLRDNSESVPVPATASSEPMLTVPTFAVLGAVPPPAAVKMDCEQVYHDGTKLVLVKIEGKLYKVTEVEL